MAVTKEAQLKKVTDKLTAAVEEKNAVERDAQACQDRLALAERLVSGLADENNLWSAGVAELQSKQHALSGLFFRDFIDSDVIKSPSTYCSPVQYATYFEGKRQECLESLAMLIKCNGSGSGNKQV